jgi:RNA polymerase sigma-70 factor (ECF subfamily)
MTDSAKPPDEELLRRIATGDADAMAVLFRRRQGNVYRFALHLTGSASVADDVTQDVFIAVIRDAHRFEPGRAAVAAWLCGIARNYVRRRLTLDRAISSLDDEEAGEVAATVTPDPLEDLTTAERIEALRRGVLSLPLRYREAVVLCDLQEMSYADAAQALGCPIGTVRSRLNRGRTLLTEKLQAEQRQAHAPSAWTKKCLA